jgi:ribosomal RNA-processing protein 1
MDKFLYLVRVYLRAAWKRLSTDGWDPEMLEEYLAVLREVPLNPEDQKIPNGMRYHVIDVYVDELEESGLGKEQKDVIEKLLTPLRELQKQSPTKTVRSRAAEALEDPRLDTMFGVMPSKEHEDEEWGGIGD